MPVVFRYRGYTFFFYSDGYGARELRELLEIVEINKDRIERAWNEFFR